MSRSPSVLVGLLGILKAGGTYLPLDPDYPQTRLAFMLEDSRAQILLTEQRLEATLPPSAAQVVCIDADWVKIEEMPDDNPSVPQGGTSTAYVLYTSGSTGKPKGVMVSRDGLANLLLSMAAEPGITARDTLVAVTTLSFDIAALELFGPLIVGGTVVLASRETATHAAALAELLTSCQATIMQATPRTWRMLIDGGWPGDRRLKALCGGESMVP